MTASVLAIIVTYQRVDVLNRCLEAVLGQTRRPDAVLVVDNGSTDETAGMLRSWSREHPDIQVLRLPQNTGPAGGFAAGLRLAIQGAQERFWVMDDDILPRPDCLERMLAHPLTEPAVLWPEVFDESERATTRYPAWHGFLISRATLELLGYPMAELFWWMEDTEYLLWRAARKRVSRAFCGPAKVVHLKASKSRGVKAPWTVYYEVRNNFYLRLYVVRVKRWKMLRGSLRVVLKSLASSPRRLEVLSLALRGLLDGVLGRLGKRVDPASRT